jgi:hypothetical protein
VLFTRLKKINFREKLNAFLIHIGISLIIFFALSWLIYFHWYPVPFFRTDGGWQGLRLIAFVDLVLGPSLTFIVFKRGKPSLKFDLTLIGLAQLAALIWGIWAVQNEKPVALVFADESFRTIPHYQFTEAGVDLKDLKKFGANNPVKIFVKIPNDQQQRLKLFEHLVKTRGHLYLQGQLYRPFTDKNKSLIKAKSINMEEFLADKPEDKVKFRSFIDNTGKKESDYLFIPYLARFNYYFLVIDKKTWEFSDVLDIRPPQFYPRTINVNRSEK